MNAPQLYTHTVLFIAICRRIAVELPPESMLLLLPASLPPWGPSGCPASLPASPGAAPCDCFFPLGNCFSPSNPLLVWRAALSLPGCKRKQHHTSQSDFSLRGNVLCLCYSFCETSHAIPLQSLSGIMTLYIILCLAKTITQCWGSVHNSTEPFTNSVCSFLISPESASV